MPSIDHLVVIGDVHGESVKLSRAIQAIRNQSVEIVFVGDYVNRGPDSRGVIDQLLELKREFGERLTLLRGNHDQVLLDFLNYGDIAALVGHGGIATVRSYMSESQGGFEEFRDLFPEAHLSLLNSTVDFYEDHQLLITHAGFDPSRVGCRDGDAVRGSGHRELFSYNGPFPNKFTIFGHYVQRTGRPWVTDSMACIDTGCGSIPGAPLSVMYWPSKKMEMY
ncbi:metallophosphoesterase [Nocardioides bruguierae]|uniref:metallophosphoesterase n=1 Tax=Nocardioides bruguierae TaxID=2945102 RepID=UPI00355774D7